MRTYARYIDWWLLGAALLIAGAGLVTMNSFVGENYFFERQILWIGLAVALAVGLSFIDFRFLRRTVVVTSIYVATVVVLALVFVLGDVVLGAQSRFHIGSLAIQPSDPAKLAVILLLAKYFSRRHVEIAHIRHILISGFYTFLIFLLIFLQPDFGSAIIIFGIWLGMVLVSGISKKHLFLVFVIGVLGFAGLWFQVFEDYQKERIVSFLNPLTDIQGAGYNAYQSTIAVGSGEVLGKGVGYGTQSRLEFLPEYETDFIFAAFAEEWGFVGVTALIALFGVVIWRILVHARQGATNFEMLFAVGIAAFLISHFVVHVGMNIGLLPVTGVTLPFMSYGGSHMLTEFAALGILFGMRRYARTVHREDADAEIVGV